MKKVGILLESLFDDQELIYPLYRLKEDYEVHLIGTEKGTEYKGKAGVIVESTHASKDVKADDYAALFIPGGYSPDHMRRCKATIELVKDFNRREKPIAAICHGPWMLASCCDLKGKDITSYFSIKDDLINAGANWIDKELVVSGNLMTSRNPGDLPVLIKEFVRAIK